MSSYASLSITGPPRPVKDSAGGLPSASSHSDQDFRNLPSGVIPRPDETLTLAEVVAYLETKEVAKQKFPERLEIVGEFPMTASGKVQKFRLREIVAAKLGLPPVR